MPVSISLSKAMMWCENVCPGLWPENIANTAKLYKTSWRRGQVQAIQMSMRMPTQIPVLMSTKKAIRKRFGIEPKAIGNQKIMEMRRRLCGPTAVHEV
jgi:hypothetical protein